MEKKNRERKRAKRQEKVANKRMESRQSPNLSQTQLVEELRKTPIGKSAIISAARSLTKKGFTKKFLADRLKLNRRTLAATSKLNRKTRINVKKIRELYSRSDASRIVPQRRFATKDGQGYLLLTSVKEAYSKYKEENTQETIGFSTFAALRPRNVRLLTNSHRKYCMCGYCMNVRNKLLTLEHAKNRSGPKAVNETKLLDIILCPKPSSHRFFEVDCIEGTCEKCKNYLETLEESYKEIPQEKQLTWNRWERDKGKIGLVVKTGKKIDLLRELVDKDILNPAQGTTFLKHLHKM